ncbi:hypothetical protein LXL04_003184 [Taraxacum kok-saghyz]
MNNNSKRRRFGVSRCAPAVCSFRFTTKPKPFRDSLGGAFGVHTHIDVDLLARRISNLCFIFLSSSLPPVHWCRSKLRSPPLSLPGGDSTSGTHRKKANPKVAFRRAKWINGNVCCVRGKMDDIPIIVAEVVVHETVILGTETAAALKAQIKGELKLKWVGTSGGERVQGCQEVCKLHNKVECVKEPKVLAIVMDKNLENASDSSIDKFGRVLLRLRTN